MATLYPVAIQQLWRMNDPPWETTEDCRCCQIFARIALRYSSKAYGFAIGNVRPGAIAFNWQFGSQRRAAPAQPGPGHWPLTQAGPLYCICTCGGPPIRRQAAHPPEAKRLITRAGSGTLTSDRKSTAREQRVRAGTCTCMRMQPGHRSRVRFNRRCHGLRLMA